MESPYCSPYWLYWPVSPLWVQEDSPFFTPCLAFTVCGLFDDGHSDPCWMVPHCSFDLRFSGNEQCWTSFHVFFSHLYREAWRAVIHGVAKSRTWVSDRTELNWTDGGFIPRFLRNLHTVFRKAISIYIPTNSARVFPFLHTLSSIYCL